MDLAEQLRTFYAGRDGWRAARIVAGIVAPTVRREANTRFLAMGYPRPLLAGLSPDRFERAVMLSSCGVPQRHWPPRGANCAVAGYADDLPFSGAMFDQVLMVHALEHGDPRAILHEAERVLAPAGDLILIAPNRAGLWTHFETTPFGLGRPFGRGELRRLLRDSGFEPISWKTALVAPPVAGLRWMDGLLGRAVPRLGGIHFVLARKSGGPAAARVRSASERARRPGLVPAAPVAARAMPSRRLRDLRQR